MSTELFLTTHRQHERELQRRLEHARVARERAAAAPAPRPPAPAPGIAARVVARVTEWVARSRTAARDASAPTVCCQPA